MRIVRFVPMAAISLATGLWFGGAAFAGGAYGSAISVVDPNPSLIVSVKGSRYYRRHSRGSRRNRQSFNGSRHYRQSFKGSRHNRRNSHRYYQSHRRHNNRFRYSYGYLPYYSCGRSSYGYDYYRPYSHCRYY